MVGKNWLQNFTKSEKDKWIGGVCGGLGEHTFISSWCWRVVFCLLFFMGGFGLLLYVLLWVFVPNSKTNDVSKEDIMTQQILCMRDLVSYQDGSVVSKEIIKKQTGTVTLFAFDQDQGLSEHTAPFDALVCVLDGEVEIVIAGEPHLLKEGDMIIMPGGKPHALKALKRFKMMLVMIRS